MGCGASSLNFAHPPAAHVASLPSALPQVPEIATAGESAVNRVLPIQTVPPASCQTASSLTPVQPEVGTSHHVTAAIAELQGIHVDNDLAHDSMDFSSPGEEDDDAEPNRASSPHSADARGILDSHQGSVEAYTQKIYSEAPKHKVLSFVKCAQAVRDKIRSCA